MAIERLLSSSDILFTPIAPGTFKATLTDGFKSTPKEGPKGEQGLQGLPGPPGPAGASGTIAFGRANGSGANYTVTDAYTDLNFGGAQIHFNLPKAGTYFLIANIQFLRTANATAEIYAKLYDTVATGDIPNSERQGGGATGDQFEIPLCLTAMHTIEAATTIMVKVKKTGQPYTADADRSSSQWIQVA